MQNDSMSIMYVYLYMAFPLNMAATLKLTALALDEFDRHRFRECTFACVCCMCPPYHIHIMYVVGRM